MGGPLKMGGPSRLGGATRDFCLLLALAITSCQAFQLAQPGSEEAQHHHHHDHGHEHAHHHDHEHNKSENLNGVISDIFEGEGAVREGKAAAPEPLEEAAGTLEEAVARGGVDFSGAEVVVEEDGTVKECVEKEEFREEYRYTTNAVSVLMLLFV